MAYTNEALGKALEDLTAAYNNFIEKAKEAAIAAMGDTVIAKIQQDAKEFIAAELATQKDALEKAIEHAKIALHNSAIEAGNKLEQVAVEKKSELAALILTAENTLKEKTAASLSEIKTEHSKLKEIAAASKAETENAVLKAKQDLEEHGKAVSLKIGGDMKERLDRFGETLSNKITEAKNAIEGSFAAQIKKQSDKLEAEMLKLKEFFIHKDTINTIMLFHYRELYAIKELKIKNLKNTIPQISYENNIRYTSVINNFDKFYKNVTTMSFIKEGIYRHLDKRYEIPCDTAVSLYFKMDYGHIPHINDCQIAVIIRNFYFLEHIYFTIDNYYNSAEIEQIKEAYKKFFHIIDCPNFKGFEILSKEEYDAIP